VSVSSGARVYQSHHTHIQSSVLIGKSINNIKLSLHLENLFILFK
jgi:hypothetical protein